MPLRNFFALLERRPTLTLPTSRLADALGAEAARSLCAAGILVPSGPATWFPCARDLRSCRRTTVLDGANLQLVCGRGPGQCATETVAADACGEHALDETVLVQRLRDLFRAVDGSPRREGRGEPLALGCVVGGVTDVWLWLRPDEPPFSDWLAELAERRPRPQHALVLVPTPRRVRFDTFQRYGRGCSIEVVYLDEVLGLDGERIVLTQSVSSAPARVVRDPIPDPGTRVRVQAGVRWSHLTVEYVDDDLVGIRVGAHPPIRVSAAELGLTHARTGRPLETWTLLRALCEGQGTATPSGVGLSTLGALRVLASRLGQRLSAAFGVAGSPLHVDGETGAVRAEFTALPEPQRTMRRREYEQGR